METKKDEFEIMKDVILRHPEHEKKYLRGDNAVLGFLIGVAMKENSGKPDPKKLNEAALRILRRNL